VPTDAFRIGDFSDLRNTSGALIMVYDPLSTCGRLGNAACGVNANGTEVLTRQPFLNNAIPAARLDRASRVLSGLWAKPNAPGQPFTGVNNFTGNASVGGNNDQYNGRVDHSMSDKQRLFARVTYWTNLSLPIDPYNTKVCQDRCTETFQVHQGVIGDTYTISPTTVADFRIAFVRFAYDRVPSSLGEDLTKYGWPAFLNNQVSFRVLPTTVVQGFSDIFTSQGPGTLLCSATTATRSFRVSPRSPAAIR